ncbi:Carboxymuconolactone decarboxylase [Rhizobium sp. CF080]|uniref:carboxymuconolactone decarboxylase family protein n=1 Tax=Rhizobium sp. (strain CF080) TaxID=1144310 RepID=UPI0002716FB1|nr:carboxymuconolactone decarboxylase family protein [Rhizobium sp. CF080]EUB98178.1 Carboxymuconolactone decarboxylase [Rhizobium sp. CF080]
MPEKSSSHAGELIDALERVYGQPHASFAAIAELDPAIADGIVEISKAIDTRGALSLKDRALIQIALTASPTHLKAGLTRLHIADALDRGASKEEICEVLELASVLGIHGFIPGVQLVLKKLGGLENAKTHLRDGAEERMEKAKAAFLAKRGYMGDIWEANCWLGPDFVTAYASYSGVPWQTKALSPKMKEFIYVTIDLSPTHGDAGGAYFHLEQAMDRYGATLDEIMEVLEIIGMFGFQTHMMALPILKEELAKRA